MHNMMNIIKKLLFLLLSIKWIRKLTVFFVRKFIIKNNFINETLDQMTDPELHVFFSKMILNKRLQRLYSQDCFTEPFLKSGSFFKNLLENNQFFEEIIHEDIFLHKLTTHDQFVVLKSPGKEDPSTHQSVHIQPKLKNARVSILICTPDIQSEFTKRCTDSVKKYTKGFTYELIYLENGNFHDFNHAREMNRAMSLALGDYFVTLDEDVEVTPNWLESLLACAEDDVGVVGCMNLDSSTNKEDHIRYTGTWFDNNGDVQAFNEKINEPIYSPWVCSCCILINNKKLKFNEKYEKYYFEADFCYRIWESGQRVVVAPHSIYHYTQGTLKTMGHDQSSMTEMILRDRVLFKKIWVETGRMQKLYNQIQPFIPFRIG